MEHINVSNAVSSSVLPISAREVVTSDFVLTGGTNSSVITPSSAMTPQQLSHAVSIAIRVGYCDDIRDAVTEMMDNVVDSIIRVNHTDVYRSCVSGVDNALARIKNDIDSGNTSISLLTCICENTYNISSHILTLAVLCSLDDSSTETSVKKSLHSVALHADDLSEVLHWYVSSVLEHVTLLSACGVTKSMPRITVGEVNCAEHGDNLVVTFTDLVVNGVVLMVVVEPNAKRVLSSAHRNAAVVHMVATDSHAVVVLDVVRNCAHRLNRRDVKDSTLEKISELF